MSTINGYFLLLELVGGYYFDSKFKTAKVYLAWEIKCKDSKVSCDSDLDITKLQILQKYKVLASGFTNFEAIYVVN